MTKRKPAENDHLPSKKKRSTGGQGRRLTPCSVTLDSGWCEGEVKKRLDAESRVSYGLWLEEKSKVQSWKTSQLSAKKADGKPSRAGERKKDVGKIKSEGIKKGRGVKKTGGGGGGAKSCGNKKKKKTRKVEKNGDAGSSNGTVDDERKSCLSSRTKSSGKKNEVRIMNFKEKKRKPEKVKAAASAASAKGGRRNGVEKSADNDGKGGRDGGDGRCDSEKSHETDSSSDGEDRDDEGDSSDDGGIVDTDNLTQKQARDLVRKISDGRINKRLPTRADKLFARWQLAKSLPAVTPQPRDTNCVECPAPILPRCRKKLRVISLFDGISTALVALKSLGLEVEKYVASEVDEHAIKCSKRNHPEIVQIGDVRSITEENLVAWGPFDLMVGGSPCNDFSRANPRREGFTGKWGKLFFDYARILAICKEKHEEANVESPFYWLFENVIMDVEDKVTISYTLGCDPVSIDAMYVSPMRRQRLYWSNIPGLGDPIIPNPKLDRLFLQECLEPGRTARVKRIGCITTRWLSMAQGKFLQDPVYFRGKPDKLWSVEIERCFGFPDHYTDVANLTADRRMGLLGMSWSIPCVRHLFEPLLMYFKSHYS